MKSARALLAAASLALCALSCSGLGDPVVEPDPDPTTPPPTNPRPGTTFLPELPARGDTTIREGQLLEIDFFAHDPDSLGVVYLLQGPGSFSGAEWAWRPGFEQEGFHDVRIIAHVPDRPDWADTLSFKVVVLNEPRPGPRLAIVRDTTIPENQVLSLTLSASDPRDRGVGYSMSGPAGATLAGANFSWKPSFAQAGVHNVVFRVSENGSSPRRDSLRVRVTVQNVDRPPVLQALRDTLVDTSRALQLTLSAVDPDGDPVVYGVHSPSGAGAAPQGASVTGSTFTWKPGAAQAGTHTLLFSAFANGLTDIDTVVVTVTVPAGPPGPGGVTLPDPVAYWSFDETSGTRVGDALGARPITLYGGVTRVVGVSGAATRFNGTAAQYGEAPTVFPDMTEQTLAAWVYVDSLHLTTVTLIQESDGASGRDNELSIERPSGSSTWKFMYRTRDDDGRHFSNGSIAARKWHYLAGVTTRDTVRLYINGALDAVITTPGPFNLSGNHYRIQIGRKHDGNRAFPFNLFGVLDEVKLFDKALTAEQIQAEWNRHKTAAGY